MNEHFTLPITRCHSGKFGLNFGAYIYQIEPSWYCQLFGGCSYDAGGDPLGPFAMRNEAIMAWVTQLQ